MRAVMVDDPVQHQHVVVEMNEWKSEVFSSILSTCEALQFTVAGLLRYRW